MGTSYKKPPLLIRIALALGFLLFLSLFRWFYIKYDLLNTVGKFIREL